MSEYERTLSETSTWAVAVVCFVMLAISIIVEHLIHIVGKWLEKKNKPALVEALEKIKAELMLMGFISLLLTVFQDTISEICVSKSIASTWHPCRENRKEKPKDEKVDKCSTNGKNQVAFVTAYGIHQLHIFIFVLAVFHVFYCIITYAFGKFKMKQWKAWETETKTIEYQYQNDPERFRFARETSFGRRHMRLWSRAPVLLWIVCFFRQFFGSVNKVDYLTLRHGFITAHLAPGSETTFDFQKYINRSLEEDFKVVVGISPVIWFIALLFLLTNTYGSYAYLWFPFIPLIIILLVGTKLQVIITRLGLRIQERGDVVKGTPVVQPRDDLFWFGRPRFLLFLIHLVLFQNAFQLAFFIWSLYAFKTIRSCIHEKTEDIVIRVSMGVLIQVLCSYVTLPLYALVTQMGSTMRPTVFNDKVATGLKHWQHEAKKHAKHSKHSSEPQSRSSTPTYGMSPVHHRSSVAPDSFPRNSSEPQSRSSTPTYGMSPVHHHSSSIAPDSFPRNSNLENEQWDPEALTFVREQEVSEEDTVEHKSLPIGPATSFRTQPELGITLSDFSFRRGNE